MFRRWFVLAPLLLVGCTLAYAATDAFFAGRSIRMTRIAAGTCTNAAYSCSWFDTSKIQRFWNGSHDLYTVNANGAPPASGRYVLVVDRTDGGVKWISPTDGGLVLP